MGRWINGPSRHALLLEKWTHVMPKIYFDFDIVISGVDIYPQTLAGHGQESAVMNSYWASRQYGLFTFIVSKNNITHWVGYLPQTEWERKVANQPPKPCSNRVPKAQDDKLNPNIPPNSGRGGHGDHKQSPGDNYIQERKHANENA